MVVEKYSEVDNKFPAVVDYIDFVAHAAIDIIHFKWEGLKNGDSIEFDGQKYLVVKKLKDEPIKTEMSISARTEVRKVRYYCNKI